MKQADSVKCSPILPLPCRMPRILLAAATGLIAATSLQAETVLWQFDDFNTRPTTGSLSSPGNEDASGWKNVQGLSDLNGAFTDPAGTTLTNWWDITRATGDLAPRIRTASGQITTDNPMPLVALGASSVTMSWEFAASIYDYNVGLYYAAAADTTTTPPVLLALLEGNRASQVWESTSVTVTDGMAGLEGGGTVVFTDSARFVLKYHSGAAVSGGPRDMRFDNIEITYEGTADTTAPTPNPMTWAVVPTATGESSITMTATTAVDDVTGVEYSFEETSGNPGGDDSGWQSSPVYTDTGLQPGTTYTYTVKARDTSTSNNETAPSAAESATTDAADETPPPTPAFDSLPTAVGLTSISMSATAVTDPEGNGVEYYFTETSGNPGGSDSGWQDSLSYTDTGLQSGTTYSYTVKARDKSLAQNESAPSAAESATTGTPGPGDVLWGSAQDITGPLDVATAGTLVHALTGDDEGGDVTVNGVTFTQGLILTNGGVGATFPATGDANMDALLTTISFGGSTIVIPDLVPGEEYLIQAFLADTRAIREMILGDGNGNTVSLLSSPAGQQVTATFIADDTSKTLTITAVSGNTHLNAIQVRRLTEPAALRIASFSRVGGDLWEVAIQGEPETGYEFRSSPDLDFNPGTLVENLSQGDPGDPGSIGGENNSLLITDANGDGVARVTLTGPRQFIRAQSPGPLLDANFETGDGGFTVVTPEGSSWSLGTPDSTGEFGGTVNAGNNASANCWGTNLGAYDGGAGDRGYYLVPTTTALRSPVIDLTGISAAQLTFAEALDVHAGDTAQVFVIDPVTDDLIDPNPIYTAVDTDPNAADWDPANGGLPIALPAAALGQQVRLEWRFNGLGGGTNDYLGWYVDDVKVTVNP